MLTSLPPTKSASGKSLLRTFSLSAIALMVTCGLKNPGRLKRENGPTEPRETSIERLTQHMKNMSTSSIEVMVEPAQPAAPPLKQETLPLEAESDSQNPYARMEVELGSDSSRAHRIEASNSASKLSAEASQVPTQPVKTDIALPVQKHSDESKELFDSQPGIFLRYCPICGVDQLLRAKHCNVCQVCVATYDHHCPWLGTCIGEKNRFLFLLFLIVQTTEIVLALWRFAEKGVTAWQDVLMLVLEGTAGSLLALLLVNHVYLVWNNLTTWELLAKSRVTYLKNWPTRWRSPFNKGFFGNLQMYILATSRTMPLIKWHLPEVLLAGV